MAGRANRETADPHQRVVAAPSRRQLGLPGELDPLDRVPVRHSQVVQAPEEAKLDAATDESLVHGREDRLARSGVHPPEDRPLEVEEHPAGKLQTQSGREAGPAVVPALVGEGEVVHAAHDG